MTPLRLPSAAQAEPDVRVAQVRAADEGNGRTRESVPRTFVGHGAGTVPEPPAGPELEGVAAAAER
ncbi:hypothetical protein HTV80_03780 [Streptomyces sp. Vc74B-19]|uniref:hypothetical protein n=1 Tax=Streptomyces sp. Vc74B-19 TaxID=2741324 RepID=UPI001BFCC61F|nr:hypothetical protein [Streptomyces sp. Vc74B-19]MBT3162231.1 hypothetical protein [Streptomyces sp. Vc74B-19]MCO4696456.1 hypothetical protein [Streptomyces sp. RO-S4]